MQTPGKMVRLSLVVVVATLVTPLAGASERPDETKGTLVTGTGNFISEVTRTVELLDPPCVSHVTRVGNVSFTGLIENALVNGDQQTHTLRDECAQPILGIATTTYVLEEATVAGRTGGLIMEAKGIFEGDVTEPAGARTRLHFTIRGISGDLKGATGRGQHVGLGSTTGSHNTYYAEIWLPEGSK